MNEQRLIELETKFSYQEKLIEELQQTVHAQYLVQSKLEKTLNLLVDQLKGIGEEAHPSHEKPPHY